MKLHDFLEIIGLIGCLLFLILNVVTICSYWAEPDVKKLKERVKKLEKKHNDN